MIQNRNNKPDDWPTLIPFDKASVPKMTPDHLPFPICAFCETVMKSLQIPIELCAAFSFAALSDAVSKKYIVQVRPGFKVHLNEYLCGVAVPGEGKSTIMEMCLEPVNEWEKECQKKAQPEIDRAESERTTLCKRIDRLRQDAAKADKNDLQGIQDEIAELEREMPEVPAFPEVYFTDITSEEFFETMAKQEHTKLSIFSAEGVPFEIMGGLYSKSGEANIDIFMNAYSVERAKRGRRGSGATSIDEPCSSIGIAVQPESVEGLGRNRRLRERGLVGRFKFLFPPSNLGNRKAEGEPFDQTAAAHYKNAVLRLYRRPWNKDREEKIIPYTITLSDQAYQLFTDYFDSIEVRMRPGGDLAEMTDIGGKAPTAAIKMAGLFHGISVTAEFPSELEICETTMREAIVISELIIKHTAKTLGVMYLDEKTRLAKKVWRWIHGQRAEIFERRRCHQNMKCPSLNRDAIDQGLNELAERGFIRPSNQGKGKKVTYTVNPYALKNLSPTQ